MSHDVSPTLPDTSPIESSPMSTPAHTTETVAPAQTDAETLAHEWLQDLPEEVVAWLVRSIGARDLWKWLNDDDNVALCRVITRGFQFNPQALRQPIVRVRLTKHLSSHSDELSQIVDLWVATQPALLDEIEALEDDALLEQLPYLWQRYGGEVLILALARARRERVLEALENIDEAVAALENRSEAHDENSSPQVLIEGSEPSENVAPPHAEAIIARLQKQLEEARSHSDALLKTLSQAQEVARKTQERLRLELAQAQREAKAQSRHLQTSQTQLSETQKTLDRTARRLRHVEKEHEETATEDKKLRKQMRRQQEINEELRKQMAQLGARLESLEPKTPEIAAPAPKIAKTAAVKKPLSPLDTPYVWKSDGRPFRVSARDVQRHVDANDEEWVFRLIQALDALREVDIAGHRLFMAAVRSAGYYYSRVLSADTTRVLVDASNVARQEKNKWGKGQLRHLLSMRDELRRRDCFPIHLVADASLPHNIDARDELMAMITNGEIEMTRVGQEADEILAREARRTGAYVVTNDRAFFHKVTPDFEPPRITFRIHDGFLIVDEF